MEEFDAAEQVDLADAHDAGAGVTAGDGDDTGDEIDFSGSDDPAVGEVKPRRAFSMAIGVEGSQHVDKKAVVDLVWIHEPDGASLIDGQRPIDSASPVVHGRSRRLVQEQR